MTVPSDLRKVVPFLDLLSTEQGGLALFTLKWMKYCIFHEAPGAGSPEKFQPVNELC